MRVLVVEDDAELAETIAVGLRRGQLAVDVALDGRGGLDRALFTNYDVVVLDRDLPGLHGDDVCAEIAAAGCRSRVLMLTAAASVEDRVDGLDKGADDYLPKPFALAELAARIRALLRRAEPALPPVLVHGDLAVRLFAAGGVPRRQAAGSHPEGARRAGIAARCPGPGRLGRGAAGAGVGRDGRPVQHRCQGDGQAAAPQARGSAGYRDRRPRLPHLRTGKMAAVLTSLGLRLGLRRRGFRVYLTVRLRRPVPGVGDRSARAHLLAGGHQVPGDRPALGHGPWRPWPAAGAAADGRPGGQAQAIQERAAALHSLRSMSGIALAVMTVLSVGLGWLVAGRMLRPLRMITAAAQRISASNLHERLAMTGPDDELKELADTFDALLGRLERAFDAQRQFVANASHELRTPLARQRAFIEVALDDPGTDDRLARTGL